MIDITKYCAKLSDTAYNKKYTVECGNEAFMIHVRENKVFIAFAGSDDLKDWQEDADIKTTKIVDLNLEVHHGFWNSMLQCWKSLKPNIEALYKNDMPIVITGHSKGAAMGLCLRLKLIQCGYEIEKIHFYGFGAPRFLKKSSRSRYKSYFNMNTILHENQGDPVCRLPRTYMGFTPVYTSIKVAKTPWYKRVYLIRAINHKVKTYLENFG